MDENRQMANTAPARGVFARVDQERLRKIPCSDPVDPQLQPAQGFSSSVDDEDEFDPEVAAWDERARRERLRCRVCAMTVPYGSREHYGRTRMCGYCAHEAEMRGQAPCTQEA